MGFCILGGKESYLRKTLSDLLTSLGQAVGIGATPAQFSTAINNIYTDRYTAGQDSLKVARTLTLTETQTGSNVDITDNWYTKVNASAVYNAGKNSEKAPNAGFSVYYLPSDSGGSNGIKNLTKTKTLPAGTYRLLIMMGVFGLSTPTITLKFGSNTRTYQNILNSSGESTLLPSTGSGSVYNAGGNPHNLYWQDTFSLASATSVTLTLSGTTIQSGNYRSNATLVSIY